MVGTEVPPPFSSSIQDGYLEVGEIMQVRRYDMTDLLSLCADFFCAAAPVVGNLAQPVKVDVVFRPDKAEPYEFLGDLKLSV